MNKCANFKMISEIKDKEILRVFKSERINFNKNNGLNIKNMSAKGFQKKPISLRRIGLQNTTKNNFDKYIEVVRWNPNGNKIAIAIGMNPAKCLPFPLDKTNELLCTALMKNKYDGYYLMNLFSFVAANNFNRRNHPSQVEVITKTMQTYFSKKPFATIDIVFFCGSSFYFTNKMISCFNEVIETFKDQKRKRLRIFTIGNGKAKHHHPGRCVSESNISLNCILNSRKNYTRANL